MAIQAVPLLLAGGKLGLKALPIIGSVAGAIPGLRRGNLGEAALGAGMGALTGGLGTGGAIKGVTKAGMRMAGSKGLQSLIGTTAGQLGGLGTQKAVMSALTPAALTKAARVGIPLAGIAGVAKVAGGGMGGGSGMGGGAGMGMGGYGSGMGIGGLAGGGAGLIGYGSVRGEPMGGMPLPMGMGPYGNIGPTGLPLDVLSPLGVDAGRRLRTIKDAEALRDAQNIVLPTIRKFSEQAKKDDFSRSIAARGIAQNIATNAALTEGMAKATRDMGVRAADLAGQGLITQYNY
mgnify:FL=1